MDFKIDTKEFNEALRQYVELSKKDAATVLNTKAFYVARRACWGTMRADKAKIAAFVDGLVQVHKERVYNEKTKRMKMRTSRTYAMSAGGAPIISLVINKRRGMRGEKGLRGDDMTRAMQRQRGYRMSSIGFVASGWIAAIRVLDPKAEEKAKAMSVKGAKIYGVPKGGATFATPGNLSLMIYNTAKAKSDKTGSGWLKVATDGLSNAIRDEADDTERYMARKLHERAEKFKK
jgi:hypothetical protein